MKNADKPIYPTLMQQVGENEFEPTNLHPRSQHSKMTGGLTKREYFAGLAMQGLISSCDWNVTIFTKSLIEATSKNAIELADELLKQLESNN